MVKLFFLFHLGNNMSIINVTQSVFPLTVEFNASQILHCGDLTSQHQFQGYTSLFYDNLKGWTHPKALVRLQYPPSRIIGSLLTDYSQNFSCFGHIRLLLSKINSVTH
jgi:hypothetical protein